MLLAVVFFLSSLLFVHLIFNIVESFFGFRSINNLKRQALLPSAHLPKVSIIFSALNEAENLSQAVTSMLQLNYPHFEIIAINDRSTDKTGEILENFSQQFPQLKVTHVKALPENWLGKNHALYLGAKQAKGDWLLFTDADVLMHESLLSKTISFVTEKSIDHLTIYEKHICKSFWLNVLTLGSYKTYCMTMKPWRVRYAWSKKYVGHGAFNLIKKDVYQKLKGHRSIAMECLDDVQLGKLVKAHHYKQETVNGRDFIEREWYSSLDAMIKGLSKNSFAFFDYDLQKTILGLLFGFTYYFSPFIAIFIFNGAIFWLNVVNILLTLFLTMQIADEFRFKRRYIIFYPLGILLLFYTVAYSMFLTYKNNGIYWRDTHYLLPKLRSKPQPEEIS